MGKLRVLIVGGGIAGSVNAYWLAKGGAQVTIIERTKSNFMQGQGLDVEGPGRVIARRMGVVDELRARATGEKGATLVDDENQDIATIAGVITQEIEIMRSDLVDVLLTAAEKAGDVTVQYGRTITAISQTDTKVNVSFIDGKDAEFDALIAADGLRSKTRPMIVESNDCLQAKDLYCAFFRIPREKHDTQISRFQNAKGGKSMFLRPARNETMSAYLNLSGKSDRLAQALGEDRMSQKATVRDIFSNVGGLAPRLISRMMESDDFYFERITQVKLPKWWNGRCVLIGDAAYGPGPITGQGTNLGIIGAYVCAGELIKNPGDPAAAFEAYEARCRAYVENAQIIPLGGRAPEILNPQSTWGIWLIRAMFWTVANTGVWKLFNNLKEDTFEFPDYPKMTGVVADIHVE